MSALILLIALILAGVSAWFFWQWKTPTIKDKIKEITEKLELEIGEKQDLIGIDELDTMTAGEVQARKAELEKAVQGLNILKSLTKEQAEKADDDMKKLFPKIPVILPLAQEVLTLTQEIKTGADFSKKSPYLINYVLTGGVGLGVFFLCLLLFSKFFGIMKLNETKQ